MYMVDGLLFFIWSDRFPSAKCSRPQTHKHTYSIPAQICAVHADTLALSLSLSRAHTNTHHSSLTAAYTCKSYTNQSGPGAWGEQPGIAPKKPNPLYQTARCHYQSSSTGRCSHQAGARRHDACWSRCGDKDTDLKEGRSRYLWPLYQYTFQSY